jgi:hypothetical protein
LKRFFALLLTLAPLIAIAAAPSNIPPEMPLEQMVQSADHIVIGQVVDADLVDKFGKVSNDPNETTGEPGSQNTIRLHIKVDKVLATNIKKFPKLLKVPLNPAFHYSLGQIKTAHSGKATPFLVLLKGPSFEPIQPGLFGRPLTDKKEVLRLYAKTHH